MACDALRVLAIVPCPVCFGLQNLTLALFGRLPDTVRSHFLNTRWTDGEFGRRLTQLGIPFSSTWLGMFSRKLDRENLKMTLECLMKLPIAWWDFLKLYRSLRPDVVYLANHHEVILLWPLLLFVRRKVICHMHDPPPAIAFQKLSFFVWRRAVGRFIFVSHNARARLACLGRLTDKDVVLQNGVDVLPLSLPRTRSDLFLKQFGWPPDAVIFGITGQTTPQKGHEDFLAAARTVRERCPRARFVIGSRQQGDYFEFLQRRAGEYGLSGSLGFSGWLPRSSDFIEAIDVLVLASRHEEGFGLVIAEAGERGLAVIATKSGGALDILVDGVTGLLVDRQDVPAMAAAMSKLAEQAALRSALGAEGRRRVEQFFDLAIQTRQFKRILQSTRVD